MKMNEVIGAIAALAIAYVLANMLTAGFAQVGLFAYAEKAFWLVPPGIGLHQIGEAIGRLLWTVRSLDVIGQVIVLYTTALGVMALLREEVEEK
ncbi:MAG: hypothetical protein DRJ26_04025 [Candidatus Methanomethylicota archaeon]|uniref:Uncharacterized protein n=1 Tax=Thermoproteota archaeon TaxID=2056631 RepID=A0A497F0E6_9CREN|nr:MAG: hypothetical protein DRJ26_04025 [Candidatus Verstraetearchaeota archaeon]